MASRPKTSRAIVLSGGGARGAYQVGVLLGLSEISKKAGIEFPAEILIGVSAGAINATGLASTSDGTMTTAVGKLVEIWSNVTSEQVFRSDMISLGKIGLRWMGGLSLGGLTEGNRNRALLDTSPLRRLLETNLDTSLIRKNLDEGRLKAIGLTAIDYETSHLITFVEGTDDAPMWKRSRRQSVRSEIMVDHIMASSAIPLLFPAIPVLDRFYGDGCVRNLSPLSPALHLGADKIFVIGVRKQLSFEEMEKKAKPVGPSIAKVTNVLLNSVMLDGVEVDLERLARINEFLTRIDGVEGVEQLNFRAVTATYIHPSTDVGAIASSMSSRLPRSIRYLLKGLGPLEDASEIVSYLLFDPEFCRSLIDEGYKDAILHKAAIELFLSDEHAIPVPSSVKLSTSA